MKLIDKSALVAEIEKKKKLLPWGSCASQISMECNCKNEAYNDVISLLNTLEVKEVDLEKELDSMITPELKFHKALPSLFDVAKHFFELGMMINNKAQKGEEV